MRLLTSIPPKIALVAASLLLFAEAHANTFLDAQLRTQLDRMFFPEQYVLDIRPNRKNGASDAPADISKDPLPGLALAGSINASQTHDPLANAQNKITVTEDTDILLVVDKSVSKDRMRMAEEVVRHILQSFKNSNRLNLKMSQREILKTMPDALKQSMMPSNMPQPYPQQQNRSSDPSQSDKARPEKNLVETVMENRDFALRALFVLWAAIGSLLGIFAVLRGISNKNSGPNITVENKGSRDGGAPTIISHSNSSSETAGSPLKISGSAVRRAATREELYSKDEAAAKLNAEIVGEASAFPVRTAHILSRWVESSSENTRYASMFLKNCDVKTIEAICTHMHPADIEAIMGKKIDGFDPFGDENARVMELMRNEIALMAATRSSHEKSDPMEFARVMPEEELVTLLTDEDQVTIAAVVAHLRPHRVSALFKEIGPDKFAEIMKVFTSGDQTLSKNFEAICDRLAQKATGIQANPINGKNRVKTIIQMVEATLHPTLQREAMLRLFSFDPEVYSQVRENILLPDDFNSFTLKTVRTITQNIEADVLGAAFCGQKTEIESFFQQIPEGYRIAFDEVRARELPPTAVEESWKRVYAQIQDLLENGILSQAEIASAKTATDARIRNSLENEKNAA